MIAVSYPLQMIWQKSIANGDTANYLGLLAEADAFIEAHGLDLPPEEDAKIIGPDPDCMKIPIRQLDLAKEGHQHHYLGDRLCSGFFMA